MSAKACLLAVSLAVVILPWLVWRLGPVRRVAPLAVVQILAGVALGPSGFGQIAPGLHAALFSPPVLAALEGISSLGVLLYVFVTGLHLDLASLRRDARRLGAVALGSVSAPLLLGLGAGAWMLRAVPAAVGPSGGPVGFVAAVAICTAVTALPVLAAVLGELGLIGTRLGQTAIALAALNDAALWVMLAALLAVAGEHGGAGGLLALGAAALWFALLPLAVRPVLSRFAGAGEQAVLAAGVGVALLSAGVSEFLGTGYLLGAFAAGAVVPRAWRATLLGRLELLTATVLLPFFFTATGLRALIEPDSARFWGLLAVVVAATVAGKLLGTAPPARRLGFSWAESLMLGAMMQTKGLMEVVVLGVLRDAGLIGGQVFSALVAMAVVCTVLTAPVVRLCGRLEENRRARAAAGDAAPRPAG